MASLLGTRRRDTTDHESFVVGLLGRLQRCADASGGPYARNVSRRMATVADRAKSEKQYAHDSAVLEGRYTLGADDGNYLRADVMPLHAVDTDQAVNPVTGLFDEVENAGKAGLLEALEDQLQREKEDTRQSIVEAAHGVAWLLSMNEILDHVDVYLARDGASEHSEEARTLLEPFQTNKLEAEQGFVDTVVGNTLARTKFCLIAEALLVALAAPLEAAEVQKTHTVSTEAHKGRKGLEYLARGVAALPDAEQSDRRREAAAVRYRPVNDRAPTQPAIGASIGASLDALAAYDTADVGVSFYQKLVLLGLGLQKAQRTLSGTEDGQAQLPPQSANDTPLEDFYAATDDMSQSDPMGLARAILNGGIYRGLERDLGLPDAQLERIVSDLRRRYPNVGALVDQLEASGGTGGGASGVAADLARLDAAGNSYTQDIVFLAKRLCPTGECNYKDALETLAQERSLDDAALNSYIAKELNMSEDAAYQAILAIRGSPGSVLGGIVANFDEESAKLDEAATQDDDVPPLEEAPPPPRKPTPMPPADNLPPGFQDAAREEAERRRLAAENPDATPSTPPTPPVPPDVRSTPLRVDKNGYVVPQPTESTRERMTTLFNAWRVRATAGGAAAVAAAVAATNDANGNGLPDWLDQATFANAATLYTYGAGVMQAATIMQRIWRGLPGLLRGRQATTAEDRADTDGYCIPPTRVDDDARKLDGLCAAMNALREDPGPIGARMHWIGVQRGTGISPLWRWHDRSPPREDNAPDWWRERLWPLGTGLPVPGLAVDRLADTLGNGTGTQVLSDALRPDDADDPAHDDVRYCLSRGLVGIEGPHHTHGRGAGGTAGTGGVPYRGVSLAAAVIADRDRVGTTTSVAIDPVAPPGMPDPLYSVYSFPYGSYDGPSTHSPIAADSSAEPIVKARKESQRQYKLKALVSDFVLLPRNGTATPDAGQMSPTKPTIDRARIALWLPVQAQNEDRSVSHVPSRRPRDQSLCKAAIYEHLVDHYAREAVAVVRQPKERAFAIASRAAAKMAQLTHMAVVARAREEYADDDIYRSPMPYGMSGQTMMHVTRPVLRCPNGSLRWPADAGLATFVVTDDAKSNDFVYGTLPNRTTLASVIFRDTAVGAGVTPASVEPLANVRGFHRSLLGPRLISTMDATSGLRAALGKVNSDGYVPIYVSAPPERTPVYAWPPVQFPKEIDADDGNAQLEYVKAKPRQKPEVRPLQQQVDPTSVTPDALRGMLNLGLEACKRLDTYDCEEVFLKKQKDRLKGSHEDEQELALRRRAVVFDDALREAAIGGDRLWSFAKQYAGVTSETVESVMVIDESALEKQQRDMRDQRRHAAERAADAHFRIVSDIFKAALTDSGLRLGVDTKGAAGAADGTDGPVLNLVSDSVRKKVAEITKRAPESGRFFDNAVKLDELLTGGAGDMTIVQLFDQLRKVGRQLQAAALGNLPMQGAQNASLEFLGAPRNSLFIRWRPEAKAAMRQAFDIFRKEIQVYHSHSMRHISAYELVEGASESLCDAFASLCALMMTTAKITNPSNFGYVSNQAVANTGRAIKIALQRLVNEACRYVQQFPSPWGTSRESYFQSGGGGLAMAAPALPVAYGTQVIRYQARGFGGWSGFVPKPGA